jgi:hypothetical protein
MNKKTLLIISGAVVVVGALVARVLLKQPATKVTTTGGDDTVELPINVIPVSERPYLTLSPDKTGHSLDIAVSGAPQTGTMEYELIYNASGKQEGALGTIMLTAEKAPIVKSILLGSRSAGGATTYHEGVTGGSLTVTYGETRLKESWNFLSFDSQDPTASSVDGKMRLTFPAKGLKNGDRVVTMKTFGLPVPLPEGTTLLSGPYHYATSQAVKGSVQISLKLGTGDHAGATLYEWSGSTWKKLTAKLDGDTLSASATGSTFVVVSSTQ